MTKKFSFRQTIGEETDDFEASCLNVKRSIVVIEESLRIREEEHHGLQVRGAIYRMEEGSVEFL